MRREKSDGRKVPQGRRKAVPTAQVSRGGKAATASKAAGQLGLFSDTADSPKGDDGEVDRGQPVGLHSRAVPKSEATPRGTPPAVTMEEVAKHENLMCAFARVEANKGAPGPDGESVAWVEVGLEALIPKLSRALLEGSYQPGDIRRVWIPKPGGGQRGLGIPNVVDRIVQQAVHQVLSPLYEPTFHRNSHGFRPGRSCHTAIAEAQKYLEEGYAWLVDLDVEKFFDKVNHQRLLSRLEQRVKDRRLIELIRRMLKAKVVMPDGVVVATEEGTPQGGPLSPLLSNIVLDELDTELDRRGYRFVRYADDCNIYVRSERAGHRVMASVTAFLAKRLRLTVNAAKSAVARPEERHFLGFRLRREPLDGSVEVLLSKRSHDRLAKSIRSRTPRNWGRSLTDAIGGLNVYLRGWMEFFGICSPAELVNLHRTDGHIRRRLRAIVLRHWKRKRTIARNLTKAGVKSATAWRILTQEHCSWWALSRRTAIHMAMPNRRFEAQGLRSLVAMWWARHPAPVTGVGQLTLDFG